MLMELAAILFVCTAVSHLGLVSAVERVTTVPLPIFNCPKCLTFWVSMVWCGVHGAGVVHTAAISLALAYAALWLELAMGFIDTIYYKLYEKIISTDAPSEVAAGEHDASASG